MKKTLEHIICFLILFWIVFLLGGCVKKEITRQADWETHFTDIHFADAKHGWIVGHGGWILHTADGGVNWEKQTVNTNEDLKAVYFTNLRNGWAVGDKGRIATTDDGGLHWTVEKSEISTLFLDVFFLNSKTGWIAGQDGLQYTQNGGKTWHHQQTSEFGLKGIHFVDKQRGWTVGDYDRIFDTTDGSKTWRRQTQLIRTEQDTTTVCDLHTVYFTTPYEGWCGGTDGTVFHTSNGGAEWHSQDSRLPPIYGHIRATVHDFDFINEDHGMLVAQGGFITRTEDGGDNWKPTESPTKNDLMGVQFTTPKEAWAVGMNGTLLHSTDAGQTWDLKSGTTANALQSVAFADADRAVAVGEKGTITMSDDSGKTWTDIEMDTWHRIRNLSFVTDQEGWAVGDGGLILHTTDAGLTWERQTSGWWYTLNALHFIDPLKGWIVGDLGTVLHTADGGKTWAQQAPRYFHEMIKGIFFLNETEGWVVGWPGIIFHTTDSGKTWKRQNSNTYNELFAAYFIDRHTGWVVGQLGEILHTLDGGKTWKFQRSGTQANLNKVYFADANHGLIVGDEGVILTTINGGVKWELQNSGTSNDLYSFSLSPDGILAVGEGGIAMRYSVDTEKFTVELPPAAQEMASDTKHVEPIEYHWEIVRQGNWQPAFTDTYFLSVYEGWAVGHSGTLLHTTDGGTTWYTQHIGVKNTLQRIVFIDDNHGWITGQGILLRTENGGETWQIVRDGLKDFRSMRAIHFINPKQGWIGVDEGQTLRTSDGGKTWTLQKTGTTHQPVTDIYFINSREGWAVAPQRRSGGLILHTADGGNYWQIQAKTHQRGVGIHFLDATSGWVVMENTTSLLTTDGGVTWKQTPRADASMNIETYLRTVKFRNHSNAWGIDISGTIFTTHNQGKTWKPIHATSKNENETGETQSWIDRMASEQAQPTSIRITNAHLLPDGHGWAVGAEQTPYRVVYTADVGGTEGRQKLVGQIYATTDAGKTWKHQLSEPSDNFRDVLFLNEQHGWVAGDNGALLSTENAGKTWKRLHTGTTDRIVDIHFISLNPKWGWAMSRDGTLLYTLNGNDWSTDDSQELPKREPPPLSINEAAFGNFSEGWAAGENGEILHNPDGGPIWTLQRTSTGKNLTGIDMKFAPLGWAVGTNGVIQRTVNAGDYWKFHETHTGSDLYAVSFITKRKGWAVGRAGIILSTSDGGFTWTSKESGVNQTLYDVLAISEKEIYGVGAAGTIIHSTDGGETWEREYTGINNNLYAITHVKEGDTLWAVGQLGIILRHPAR